MSGPVVDERTGRITGVTAKLGEEKREVTFRAPLVVAADGNSTRLSLAMGLHRREDRPMGVAVRTYFTSPRHDDDYLESWLELWDRRGPQDRLLPGYGWIFGMGDGTSNVASACSTPPHPSRSWTGARSSRPGARPCRRTGATPPRT